MSASASVEAAQSTKSFAEIDELDGLKGVTQLCLFYIDLQGEVQRLQVTTQQSSWL